MYATRLAFFALCAAATLTPLHAQSWHVASTFHPGGEGGLDYITVVGEKAGSFEVEQTVTTETGAQTMGLDRATQEIFLPTAEMLPTVPGHRPQSKPGTFEIVVVSHH